MLANGIGVNDTDTLNGVVGAINGAAVLSTAPPLRVGEIATIIKDASSFSILGCRPNTIWMVERPNSSNKSADATHAWSIPRPN